MKNVSAATEDHLNKAKKIGFIEGILKGKQQGRREGVEVATKHLKT